MLGPLFESLVALDVRVFAQAAKARASHLRTHAGRHEIKIGDDLIEAVVVATGPYA